jgi:hypothetical protein
MDGWKMVGTRPRDRHKYIYIEKESECDCESERNILEPNTSWGQLNTNKNNYETFFRGPHSLGIYNAVL